MLRRVLVGIRAMCQAPIRYLPDPHHVARQALEEVGIEGEALPMAVRAEAEDTTRGAKALRGAAVVIVLGGDGTNRAFAKGWLEAPLIPLSTGTNNVTCGYATLVREERITSREAPTADSGSR